MTNVEISFGPLAHNVIDYVGAPNLATGNGHPVKIAQTMSGGFHIYINDIKVGTDLDNIQASYLLNRRQVGRKV